MRKSWFLDPSNDTEIYVKDIHVFQLNETPAKKAGYYDLALPSANEKSSYGPCFFIKPVWTQTKDEAITKVEIFPQNKKLSKTYKQIIQIDSDRKMVVLYNSHDEAKITEMELVTEPKRSSETNLWSCTKNIGSENKVCSANKAFLCSRWHASDTGIRYVSLQKLR